MRRPRLLPLSLLTAAALALSTPLLLHAQADGSALATDGGGSGVLESIYVPNLPNAPFSLTLHTEWVQRMPNGGNFTEVNDGPLKRDGDGRIYGERWLLTSKGSGQLSDLPSRMTAIQVDDPVSGKFFQCSVRSKVCDRLPSVAGLGHYDPTRALSGPLKSGKGTFLHEDLGAGSVAGLPMHADRDTTTLNAGTWATTRR